MEQLIIDENKLSLIYLFFLPILLNNIYNISKLFGQFFSEYLYSN